MMIRDTSAQDRMVEVKPNRKRRLILLGGGVLALVLLDGWHQALAGCFRHLLQSAAHDSRSPMSNVARSCATSLPRAR
jgi:hypothetical protein